MAELTQEEITSLVAQITKAFTGESGDALLARRKTITGTPDAQSIFGPGGLFSNFGLDNVVINASLAPKGIDRVIPAIGSVELNPIYAFITGIDEDEGTEPSGVCDDAPSGVLEVCHQTAQFGRYTRSSKEMEVNTLMQVLNGHLTTDLQLLGSVLGDGHQFMPQAMNDKGSWLGSMVRAQLVIAGQLLQHKLARQLWVGDPSNNSVAGGYKEFPGLDILVDVGKIDAFTGTACQALDPDVKDFDYEAVDSTTKDIVIYMTYVTRWVKHVAGRTGLDPVTWAWVMRPELFSELLQVWPCRYLTNRCENSAGTAIAIINDATNVTLRQEMHNGEFLWIDGVKWPVLLDDGILEQNSATSKDLDPGEFASDLYLLPFKIQGGRPVLYWEYIDYSRSMADLSFLQGRQFWQTDGGRFMWAMQQLNYCFKFQAKVEPRVILRTPQLAGRIKNVKYSPLQHMRDPFQDSPYRKKGGEEDYSTPPALYKEWSDGARAAW
jgi:hypothetical protein